MHWKKIKDRQYLFRSTDRRGYGKSLGLRSPETEAIFRDFHESKRRLKESIHELQNQRQTDREPIKRRRDKEQALAVCMLVLHYLPHLQFDPDELRMFPKSIVTAAAEAIKASELPPGYGCGNG